MRLTQLLSFLPEPLPYSGPDVEITSITYDSRRVQPGALFVAIWHPGYSADGHRFAGDAIRRGATAVVVQRPVEVPPEGAGVPVIQVPHTPSALGWLAAGLYGLPSSRLGLAGVTGTDGKTTTCTMLAAILEAAGFRPGMVSTVASQVAGEWRENMAHTSTPEAPEIQALLAETVAAGGRRAVVEATSHALAQDRLAGCEFDVAVVTRVTHEHLDFHGTFENYIAAKARLLDLLRPDPRHPKAEPVAKAAILNADDSSFGYMAARAPAPIVRYAVRGEAEVKALGLEEEAWETRCRLVSPWGEGALRLPLPGSFNVYNALAALAAACTLGAPFEVARDALAAFRGVPGRMQRIDAGQPFTVIVDFAHTPDALTQVLRHLRQRTKGKLICVFGSAGERDRAKRPMQGRVAAELSDYFVLTDEDPRLEDREQIIDEIAQGALAAGAVEGRDFARMPDRRAAIAAALRRAQPGDTVLLAGKGHERSIIGAVDGRLHAFPWDERAVALEELRRLGYGC